MFCQLVISDAGVMSVSAPNIVKNYFFFFDFLLGADFFLGVFTGMSFKFIDDKNSSLRTAKTLREASASAEMYLLTLDPRVLLLLDRQRNPQEVCWQF